MNLETQTTAGRVEEEWVQAGSTFNPNPFRPPNPSQPPLVRGGADHRGVTLPPDKGGSRGVSLFFMLQN